jgi:bifunctional N-acetylglucosamine-1-phosphate-uridyltransferase/glucosamine-1-phosphate-acetyltransferase GlmU-like protein
MPNTYKILGQILPSANTLTNVYVTSASASAIINTITLCNQQSVNSSIDLIVRPINEALATKHYLLTGVQILQADTLIFSPGITIGPNCIIAANNKVDGNTSICAFGVEIT